MYCKLKHLALLTSPRVSPPRYKYLNSQLYSPHLLTLAECCNLTVSHNKKGTSIYEKFYEIFL